MWPFRRRQEPKRARRYVSRPMIPSREFVRRSYAAAQSSELFSSFGGTTRSADSELQSDLAKMRARARQLAEDNDHAKKFLHLVDTNVIGVRGIALQSQAMRAPGIPDDSDRRAIESAWDDWGKIGSADVTRMLSWQDIQHQVMRAIARDGEVLIVEHYGDRWNDYGFALQVIEADHLDEQHNAPLQGGGRIRMGIEQDRYGAPVAYHLRTEHPGDDVKRVRQHYVQRVPADRVLHLYIVDRPGQSRGVPWMHTAIRRMQMLGGYEESELVAARVSSGKMGFFTSPTGDSYTGDATDADGNLISEVEPGSMEQLPAGTTFSAFDPQHPTTAFDAFCRTVLRGAAAGLNVSYASLTADVSDVNYSSLRGAVMEEREHWRVLHGWIVERLHARVYRDWLSVALATPKLPLPPSRFEKALDVRWQSRGWSWVDPLKDIEASTKAIELGVATRQEIAASQGKDWDEIVERLAVENELMASLGLLAVDAVSDRAGLTPARTNGHARGGV